MAMLRKMVYMPLLSINILSRAPNTTTIFSLHQNNNQIFSKFCAVNKITHSSSRYWTLKICWVAVM